VPPSLDRPHLLSVLRQRSRDRLFHICACERVNWELRLVLFFPLDVLYDLLVVQLEGINHVLLHLIDIPVLLYLRLQFLSVLLAPCSLFGDHLEIRGYDLLVGKNILMLIGQPFELICNVFCLVFVLQDHGLLVSFMVGVFKLPVGLFDILIFHLALNDLRYSLS
jgi:hypothetical protein